MKRNKKICIAAVIIAAVILAVVWFVFMHERVALYIDSRSIDLGAKAEMFTDFDITDDTLTVIEGEYFSIGVPQEYVFEENNICKKYTSTDGAGEVFWAKKPLNSKVDFLNQDSFDGLKYEREALIKGFEKLGYGIPDNTYNSYKCMYLLDESDYSFWDYNQGLAYTYTAFIKNGIQKEYFSYYIYERDDVYALIMQENNKGENNFSYVVEFFNPENLNTSYALWIKNAASEEQAFAVINSIEWKS